MEVSYSPEFLREFIDNEGITVTEFARELQTACSVVSNWLTRRCSPSEDSADRLIRYFKGKGIDLLINPALNSGRKCNYVFDTEEYQIVPRDGNEKRPNVIPLRDACDNLNIDYNITRHMVDLVKIYGKDYLINLIELN